MSWQESGNWDHLFPRMASLYYIESATVCGNNPIKKSWTWMKGCNCRIQSTSHPWWFSMSPRWDTLGTPGGSKTPGKLRAGTKKNHLNWKGNSSEPSTSMASLCSSRKKNSQLEPEGWSVLHFNLPTTPPRLPMFSSSPSPPGLNQQSDTLNWRCGKINKMLSIPLLVGGFNQPIWNILVKLDHFPR